MRVLTQMPNAHPSVFALIPNDEGGGVLIPLALARSFSAAYNRGGYREAGPSTSAVGGVTGGGAGVQFTSQTGSELSTVTTTTIPLPLPEGPEGDVPSFCF